MNSKTIVTAMIAMIVAVGMTGAAMATPQYTDPSTTTVTYVGSGDYTADFDGRSGDVTIYTYTPEGYDVLTMSAECNYEGSQTVSSDAGWTTIDREVDAGRNPTITTYTVDTAGNYIATGVSSVGQAELNQYVLMADDQTVPGYTGDGIVAYTEIDAYGCDDVNGYVVTQGNDIGTLVEIGAEGGAIELTTLAGIATDPSVGSATGQYVIDMSATGKHGYGNNEGTADIEAYGNYEVGFDIEMDYDITGHYEDEFDTDGTLYGDGTSMSAVLDIQVNFDRNFDLDGSGYIYALSLNPVVP